MNTASGISDRYERQKKRARRRSDCGPEREVRKQEGLCCQLNEFDQSSISAEQQSVMEVGTMTEQESSTTGPLAVFLTFCDGTDASTYVSHQECEDKGTSTADLVTTANVQCGTPYKDPCFLGYQSVKEDECKLHALTAVSFHVFAVLFHLLPDSPRRTNELSLKDKLLLFLIKLRHGLPFSFLGVMFNVHRTTVSRIFQSVLDSLNGATRNWLFWPSRSAVQATMPPSIRSHYPRCRVIIDCTELKTEMPPTVEEQNLWYSQYKNAYTAKYFVGIAPNGLVTFLSSGFGGRAGDTAITIESKLLPLLQQGDEVLADKGFPGIRTGLGSRNITLVIPPFANSPQFTEVEMEATYKTASVRIHVERAIQRLKIFDIINHRIPYELVEHLDKIMHVLCVITNLKPGIFKDT